MGFNYKQAISDGWTDNEITEHLGFNYGKALSDGYSDDEINSFLNNNKSSQSSPGMIGDPTPADLEYLDQRLGFKPPTSSTRKPDALSVDEPAPDRLLGSRDKMKSISQVSTYEPPKVAPKDTPDNLKRIDGTLKENGYFGPLKMKDGRHATELSFSAEVDGKEIFAPLLVPTQSEENIQHLLSGGEPTEEMYRKAIDHAMMRMKQGKSPFKSNSEKFEIGKQSLSEDPMSQIKERKPFDSELEYFKKNTNVGGMATEDDAVILNPYSTLSDKEKKAVLKNEKARSWMRSGGPRPDFELTSKQKKAFNGYGSEQDIRETIAARILSEDPSALDVTDKQRLWVEDNLIIKPEMIPIPGAEKQWEDGPFTSGVKALARGIDFAGSGIGGAMEMTGVPGGKKINEIYSKRAERPEIAKPSYLAEGTVLDHPERLVDPMYWINATAENAPNMAVTMAAGAAAKGTGLAIGLADKALRLFTLGGTAVGSFAIEGGSAYNDAKQEMEEMGTFSPEEIEKVATTEGMIVGTANSILEALPIETLLNNPGNKKILSRIIRQSLLEGGTEAVQENVNMWVAEIFHKPDTTLKEKLGRTVEAGLAGMALGAGATVVEGAIESRKGGSSEGGGGYNFTKTPTYYGDSLYDQVDKAKFEQGLDMFEEPEPSTAEEAARTFVGDKVVEQELGKRKQEDARNLHETEGVRTPETMQEVFDNAQQGQLAPPPGQRPTRFGLLSPEQLEKQSAEIDMLSGEERPHIIMPDQMERSEDPRNDIIPEEGRIQPDAATWLQNIEDRNKPGMQETGTDTSGMRRLGAWVEPTMPNDNNDDNGPIGPGGAGITTTPEQIIPNYDSLMAKALTVIGEDPELQNEYMNQAEEFLQETAKAKSMSVEDLKATEVVNDFEGFLAGLNDYLSKKADGITKKTDTSVNPDIVESKKTDEIKKSSSKVPHMTNTPELEASVKKATEDAGARFDGYSKDFRGYQATILDPGQESSIMAQTPEEMTAKIQAKRDEYAAAEEAKKKTETKDKKYSSDLPTEKYGIYTIQYRDGVKYAVREKMENPGGFGDNLFNTPEEAEQYVKDERKRNEANNKYRAEQDEITKKEEAKKSDEQKEYENVNGFVDDMKPMVKGRILKALNKGIRVNNKNTTIKAHVEKLVSEDAITRERQEDKIKPMSRLRYFRANKAEQEYHERKVREGGKKTVYSVGGYELGKTAYDYANYLIEKKTTVKEEKAPVLSETKKTEEIIPEKPKELSEINVTVEATDVKTGEVFTIKTTAEEAINENKKREEIYSKILRCLTS